MTYNLFRPLLKVVLIVGINIKQDKLKRKSSILNHAASGEVLQNTHLMGVFGK